jgi:putative spermidine/putrescine transport system substrate-binding protein
MNRDRTTKKGRQSGISRRRLMQGAAGIAAAAAIGMPAMHVRAAGSLKVGTYGGYFKDSFDKFIYPDFTKATGIEIESVAEPTGEAWLVQLETAARAGQAPADVSMMAQVTRQKGQDSKLWATLDESKMPNIANLLPVFVQRYPDGSLSNIGAVSWYITLVTNTDIYPEPPTSWKALWDPANRDRLGLLALVSNSFLLEITSKTWFGGTDVLDTDEGIDKVFNKLVEVKPNVKLWYRDEGQFQQALETGEIPMGEYYHDVTGLAASNGKPVRSTFPKEGGVLDSGSWSVSKASDKIEEAQIFINYMCQPQVQDALSLNVGTAPTVRRDLLSLTPEQFASVSSDIPPIIPRYDLYAKRDAWLNQKWTEMIVA